MNTVENILATEKPLAAIVIKDNLVKAIKAALPWASGDTSRPDLNSVCLDLKLGQVVATDGHTLIVIKVPGLETGENVQMLLAAKHCKSIAARPIAKVTNVADTMVIDPDKNSIDFGDVSYQVVNGNVPPYTKVIPDYSSSKGTASIGVDTHFLARLEKICAIYKDGRRVNPLVKMMLGGPLDPIRFEFEYAPVTAVIMPARIS